MLRYLLIADGCESIAKRIKSYLSPRGFRVEVVTDALACLAKLKKSHPDLLVLDEDLPWGGGDGILAYMQEEPIDSQVPVVLMTERSYQEPSRASVSSCLHRPFDVMELFRAVSAALRPTESETKSARKKDRLLPIRTGD